MLNGKLKNPNVSPGGGRIELMTRGNSMLEALCSDSDLLPEHGYGGGHRQARPLGAKVAGGIRPCWRSVSEAGPPQRRLRAATTLTSSMPLITSLSQHLHTHLFEQC